MNPEQALLQLGASTSRAIQGVLEQYSTGSVIPGAIHVVGPDESAFSDLTYPAIAADVSYVDGVTGGNILIIGLEGGRRLAAAMMGADPMALEAGGELSEIEFSAVGEAMNQMISAAAMATSAVVGEEVEISPPDVRRIETADDANWDHPGQATTVAFTFCGTQCLLVQLVPNAFILRMTRALDEMTEEHDDAPLRDALLGVKLRFWAELGRAKMPSGRVAALPAGVVVDLDRQVEDPIEIYVGGLRFARGRLLVTEAGFLSVRIDEIVSPMSSLTANQPPTEVEV